MTVDEVDINLHQTRKVDYLVGAEVDLVPEVALRPDLRQRVLSEAVPL